MKPPVCHQPQGLGTYKVISQPTEALPGPEGWSRAVPARGGQGQDWDLGAKRCPGDFSQFPLQQTQPPHRAELHLGSQNRVLQWGRLSNSAFWGGKGLRMRDQAAGRAKAPRGWRNRALLPALLPRCCLVSSCLICQLFPTADLLCC